MEKLELTVEAVKLNQTGLLQGSLASTGEKQSPVYLNVDTGIDYAAIVTAALSFLVAIIVARFTVGVQQNQIQANISNFRHQWMVELRECASELVQLMALMINGSAKTAGYKPGALYTTHYSRAMQLRSKIDLLLSRDDDQSYTARKYCGDLLDKINLLPHGSNIDNIIADMVHFQNLIRHELEEAWKDTKNDLGINRKVFGFRLFK
ncbi:hypothetical protein [Pseudomonas urethralis]|uniref:hypothetical protein n=1 Tax=Pseudomonas urethralis TaxID=2740517 RepID=UPI001596A679|nr:hypothetical protein [Pseudomonas urethralis]